MKRIAIATVIAALISAMPSARALEAGACCACVPGGDLAQSNQAAPPPPPALFCAASAVNTSALSDRCVMLSADAKLLCLAGATTDTSGTCVGQLAESGIRCPTSPAPAVTPYNLAALAVVLGLLGTALLRRRRA
ncbi:MAG TPA: hypothetical protein VL049_03530 [Candidatus Dormibacteraeota bacterium]|nr:hypothetical protein [Candidatus Dormibacteraeota bacterium]